MSEPTPQTPTEQDFRMTQPTTPQTPTKHSASQHLTWHITYMKSREDDWKKTINDAGVRLDAIHNERIKLETLRDKLKAEEEKL